ncbi:MAG: fused MFS/spermidine synthase [Myxococcota bacterium]
MTALLCLLFFLSGVAALLFETLWFRQAGLAFGNGVWASSLVLASFMAGLALGNGLTIRWGARLRRPLHAYAALELAIAVAGVLIVLRLQALGPWLAPMLYPLADWPFLQNAVRLVLGFLLLLVPATAMGATLPVIVTALRARDPSFGGALGLLYGWNTLGAVLGATAGELWLLERLGLHGTALVAAGCNGLAAAGALALAPRLAGRAVARPAEEGRGTDPALRPDRVARRLLAAALLAGGLLLALEVVWFRFLHLFVHSGAAAFAWMLAVVLAGIGVGGLLGGAWLRRWPAAKDRAPAVALLGGVATAGLYAVFHRSSALLAGGDAAAPATVAGLVTVLALPVALLSGVLFPLLGAAVADRVGRDSAAAGWLTLANTVGSALGSLLAGFVLLPVLGMEQALFLLAAGYGGVAWLARSPQTGLRAPAAVLAALAWLGVLVLFPFGRMERVYLRAPIVRAHGGHEHVVLAIRAGRSETAAIVERRRAGERLHTYLLTDSYAMSATTVVARRYMKLFVWWPVAVRPDPESALLISYGVGSTARALVATPSLRSIDVVDLSREILALSQVVYPDPADDPLRDPRVRVHVEDGRHFLAMTPRRFDLITGEPPPPKAAGVVNLYTREHFRLVHDRLTEGGVATWWLPVHNLLASDALAIVRAWCDVFDDCALWVGHDLDWMLTGSRGGTPPVAEAAFGAQWRDPAVAGELRATGLGRPERLGATFLGDADWLRARTEGVPPLVDAWPKRLSDRLQRSARATFQEWMDVDAARERFRASRWVRRVWPPELRERTLAEFEAQRTIQAVARGEGLGWPRRLAEVDALLTRGDPELAQWRLGVTADHLAAAASARRGGRSLEPHAHALATRALVSADYAAAADAFARIAARDPSDAGAWLLEVYARCRAGDVAGARARLDAPAPAGPGVREAARWLRRACGEERS